jgi:glycosyltransferase involved in cell wall biosynthesis
MRPPVAALVLTRNEAANIQPCLATLQWTSDLVVVDCGSVDGTVALAQGMGARVVHHPWENWASQRNFALTQTQEPWALFVDADERVPPELAAEIQERLATAERDGHPAGFWIPRENIILGRWVRHAGWAPDYQLRLFRRDRGRYDPARPVHELVLLDGPAGYLTNRLVHHNYASWGEFWSKQCRYARVEAQGLHARGVRAKPRNFILQPWREFRRRYWTLQGYREGALGLGLSLLLAGATFVTYWELARLGRERQ